MSARPLSIVTSLLLAVPLAAQTPAPPVREDLELLGTALENAVAKVSRSPRTVGVSRSGPRGYRLPGYGAMIVLAPRALPAPAAPRAASERQAAQAVASAADRLEQSLREVQSEEARQRIQRHLKALRETEAAMRRPAAPQAAAATPEPTAAEPSPAPRDLAALERQMQEELVRQAEALNRAASARGEMDLAMQEEIDRELRAMHERAEAFRLQAERALQQVHREARQRTPGAAPVADSPETSPTLIPWQAWFDLEVEEPAAPEASPEQVIEGVRAAITGVLESQGPRLKALGPDDVVAVAVDFIPASRMSFRPSGQKTLLVRVARKHIDARQSGRISAEEFRKRVEVVEY
jgi:hypothetical protein